MNVRDADLLDRHGFGGSWVHRLDPRAKVVATLVFIIAVVSHDKYAVAQLLPYVLYPMALAVLGFVPGRLFFRRVAITLPFIAMVGAFNPLLDRVPVFTMSGVTVTAGMLSFASIMLKGLLCVGAAVALTATTSFPALIEALQALHAPRVLTVQLMLLYRYLFLLIKEAQRLFRAKQLKSSARTGLATATALLSTLLLRTLDRGEAVWLAMAVRGFEGEFRSGSRLRWRWSDSGFALLVAGASILFRIVSLPALVGQWGVTP